MGHDLRLTPYQSNSWAPRWPCRITKRTASNWENQNIASRLTSLISCMDQDHFCPICGWFSNSAKNPRSQVNRHLKEWSVKEDSAGHPKQDTQEYAELMASRGCYSASRDEDVQRLKRAARNRRFRAAHPKEKTEPQPESQPKKPSARKPSARKTNLLPTTEDRIAKAFATLR